MRLLRPSLFIFGLLAFGASAALAELATAKAIAVEGDVRVTRAGVVEQVSPGSILREGDSIYAAPLSSAILAFSNGSIITVKENTGIVLTQVVQAAFEGDAEYDQLEGDPSRSTTVLNLEYGRISGHVKQLRGDSRFEIDTPLGTAAIRGTIFECALIVDAVTGTLNFEVTNEDGTVVLIASHQSPPVFLPSGVSRVRFDVSGGEPSTILINPGTSLTTFIETNEPSMLPIIQEIYNRFFVQQGPPDSDPSPPLPQAASGGNSQPGQNPGRSPVNPPVGPPTETSPDRPPAGVPPTSPPGQQPD